MSRKFAPRPPPVTSAPLRFRPQWGILSVGLALGLGACLNRDDLLKGKACSPDDPPRCASGYACFSGTCVPAENWAALVAAEGSGRKGTDGVFGASDDDGVTDGDGAPDDDGVTDDDVVVMTGGAGGAPDDDVADDDGVTDDDVAPDDDVVVMTGGAGVAPDDDVAGAGGAGVGVAPDDGGAGAGVAPDDDGAGAGVAPDDGGAGAGGAPDDDVAGAGGAGAAGEPTDPAPEPGEPDAVFTNCRADEFAAPELVELEGITGGIRHPSLASDHQTLYFSRQEQGASETIWTATRPGRGLRFYDATPLAGSVNQQDAGSPFISADDRSLYFHSARQGSGQLDPYVAHRSGASGDFGQATLLADLASSASDYGPWAAPDESWVVFASARNGDAGDIWTAPGRGNGRYSTPVRLGGVNTSAKEAGPYLTPDTLAIYLTRESNGNSDLWVGTRNTTNFDFGNLRTMVELNSAEDELEPTLSRDNAELFFVSERSGESLLYRALADCP